MTDPLPTVCPACSVGCRLRISPANDAVIPVTEGPVNRGGMLCHHGADCFDAHADTQRIRSPMVRIDGELVPVSWKRAFTRLESAFSGLDPDSVGFLGSPHATNEANYLLGKLARCFGSNHVDTRARLCHASVATVCEQRLGSSTTISSLSDFRLTDAFLVIGANPVARQPVAFERFCRPAIESGSPLLAVDPEPTVTTACADRTLHPPPGADHTLLDALCLSIIDQGFADKSFITAHTTGSDRLHAAVRGPSVAALCEAAGVAVDDLEPFARTFATADRGAILTATGIGSCDHNGTPAADRLVDLSLLTGNAGRRGAGVTLLRGVGNEQGALDVGVRPDRLPGGHPIDNEAARDRIRSTWGVEPPTTPGLNEREQLGTIGSDINGLYVMGENPAVVRGPQNPALEGLSVLVVQDPFVTETVEQADIVLPATTWAETTGTVTNLERRIQLRQPQREGPAGVKQDWKILTEVGRLLTSGSFASRDSRAVFEELADVGRRYHGIRYDEVNDGGVQWPVDEDPAVGLRSRPFPFGPIH